MTEEHILDQLDAHLDGELDATGAAAVKRHLETCPDCRAALDERTVLHEDLRRDLPSLGVDVEALTRQIMARHESGASDSESSAPETGRILPILRAGLGVAAGFLLAWILLDPGPTVTPDPGATPAIQLAHLVGECQATLHRKAGKSVEDLLAAGDPIEVGLALSTPAGSRAEIVLSDGARLRLNGQTTLHVTEERLFFLSEGEVWVDVPTEDPVEIVTDGGAARGARATFDLRLRPSRTELLGLRGRASLGDLEVGTQQLASLFEGKGKGPIAEVSDNYFPELDLAWMVDLWRSDPSSDELRSYTLGLLRHLGETKASDLARSALLELGPLAREPIFEFLSQSPLTRRTMARRVAAELLPKLCDADTPPGHVKVLFDLLGDGDAEVRVPVAGALSRATEVTIRKDFDFWRTAGPAERAKVTKAWMARWKKGSE